MNKIIELITKKIQKCNELCFCGSLFKGEGVMTDQKKCSNCHSKDILIELLNEVNDLELSKDTSPR